MGEHTGDGVMSGGLLRASGGHAPPDRPTWAVTWRASVSYRGARFTPKVRHTAALLMPPSNAVQVAVHCSSGIARCRPPRSPRRVAAATPAVARACVKARAYWASAPHTLNRTLTLSHFVAHKNGLRRGVSPDHFRANLVNIAEHLRCRLRHRGTNFGLRHTPRHGATRERSCSRQHHDTGT
jgi:hypothetical protein